MLHPAPDTHLPIMLTQKSPKVPPTSHPYGTRSKTKVDSASLTTSYEEENHSGVIGNLFNHVTKKLWWSSGRVPIMSFLYCTQSVIFFMVVLIPTGTITVGSVVVMAAEARHPRTDILG